MLLKQVISSDSSYIFFSECIRVRYCDQHIHYDGNIGFRVPIAVKRRLFEMSFKRIPIPCMQVMLSLEAEQLLPHPTRFEEKLKNLSHVEVVELLGIINASLSKNRDPATTGKKVPIKFGEYYFFGWLYVTGKIFFRYYQIIRRCSNSCRKTNGFSKKTSSTAFV